MCRMQKGHPMTSPDDRARYLHDKATRGIALSAREQAQLEAWYADQDQAESTILHFTPSPQHLDTLHAQVATVVNQLISVTQRIHELTAQNAAVRHEIDTLQHQLAQASTHEPA